MADLVTARRGAACFRSSSGTDSIFSFSGFLLATCGCQIRVVHSGSQFSWGVRPLRRSTLIARKSADSRLSLITKSQRVLELLIVSAQAGLVDYFEECFVGSNVSCVDQFNIKVGKKVTEVIFQSTCCVPVKPHTFERSRDL